MIRTLVLTLFLAVSVFAVPGAEYKKHEKWYGYFKLNDCSADQFDALFNNRGVDIVRTQGMIVELSCTEVDSNLLHICGRFVNYTIEMESLRVEPKGDWQYPKPVVLILSDEIKSSNFVQQFMINRSYIKLEPSGDLDKATSLLKAMAQQKGKIERRNIDKIFENPPPEKKDPRVAPPVTPTPK